MTASTPAGDASFVHSAMLYRSRRECLDFAVAFVADGMRNYEPVWLGLPPDKLASLSSALGPMTDDAEVTLADITEVGRNPGRLLGLAGAFVERHRHRPVRLIGEAVWAGRSAVEYPACVQHEALVNLAFDGRRVTAVCLYDASRLADQVLADARVTHPLIWSAGSYRPSPDYAVGVALERCNEPLATSPAAVTYTVAEFADLSPARQQGSRYGRLLGLSADGIADLQLIITELATNSLQHGNGKCWLAFWEHDGHLVCEARDTGFLDDPLAGRRPPSGEETSPRGLFVVNALADLVRIHTTPGGTTIQAFLRLDRAAEDGR
ncbi:sensor histidine kinase [Mycobacterium xenopi]|uniref:Anti-sigma regulatory factor n=1 Tax=Mycobacterium xenopi TaxID=1789 RepID=A0AAD1M366_MYCXE|nr:sensor histidine kinase [Mycobacterium xenopi]ORX21871.1 regulator of Sig8 [Mycobacterium xenopi]BBU24607.1 anti-sigma regulatory factor [Mycobacterium xenopi]SPX90102.1 regulator of Sig8 [Mycobacterium xenopi]